LPPLNVEFRGQDGFDSEKLIAYEVGYRHEFHKRVSADVALFYNFYDDLRSIDPVSLAPPVFKVGNRLTAQAYGVEFAPAWQVTDWWRLQAAYTYLEIQVHNETPFDSPSHEGRNPRHQITLRSTLDLPANFQFDSTVRYVDNLPALHIPNYLVMDLRLAWRPVKNLELSIIGRDLLDSSHAEFAPSNVAIVQSEVEQSIFGKITWHY